MIQYIFYRGINIATILWIVLLIFLLRKKYWKSTLLFGCVFLLAVRMRFVEPYVIAIEYQNIDVWVGEKVVLIADMHLGVYKSEKYLERVVQKVNTLDVDRVMIAWDFLNQPLPWQSLEQLFGVLWELKKPWYAVMGNHDTWAPWEDREEELAVLLEALWWEVIDNEIVPFEWWTLVWLGSHMSWRDSTELLENISYEWPVVVLAHNPDSTLWYSERSRVDITMVGHTHCGQVRIPWLYEAYRKFIIPTIGDFDCGWTQEEYTQLFITPGLGEMTLPIRLFNPVTISVLQL